MVCVFLFSLDYYYTCRFPMSGFIRCLGSEKRDPMCVHGQHGAQDCANIPSQHYENRVWAIGGVEGTVLPGWRRTSLECCST